MLDFSNAPVKSRKEILYVLVRMIQKTLIADVNTISPKETKNIMREEDKGTEN